MATKPPSEPTIESMDGEFRVITATMRGIVYQLRELPADEYQKCIEKATTKDKDIDNEVLFKLMLDKSLVKPELTVAEVMKKPYPVVRKLNEINDVLHYTPETTEEENAEKAAEDEEGKSKG